MREPLTAATLKARHRQIRERQPENLNLRIHRAISWLGRAELEAKDPDAAFIFQWIALNAAYAHEFSNEQSEREQARRFVAELLEHDQDRQLHAILFGQFSGPIRTLIENKFVFEPFWKALREHDSSEHWQRQFTASRKKAMGAVLGNKTDELLSVVLDRLYVLRNQLVHGGATWNGSTNRAQVQDGAAILGALLPAIIEIMMRIETTDLGRVTYPVIST